VEVNGRTGPVTSDWSEKLRVHRPVVSDWSGGVGLVCGMKRGIWGTATTPSLSSVHSADVNHLRVEDRLVERVTSTRWNAIPASERRAWELAGSFHREVVGDPSSKRSIG